jgi:hypothetical protein
VVAGKPDHTNRRGMWVLTRKRYDGCREIDIEIAIEIEGMYTGHDTYAALCVLYVPWIYSQILPRNDPPDTGLPEAFFVNL